AGPFAPAPEVHRLVPGVGDAPAHVDLGILDRPRVCRGDLEKQLPERSLGAQAQRATGGDEGDEEREHAAGNLLRMLVTDHSDARSLLASGPCGSSTTT